MQEGVKIIQFGLAYTLLLKSCHTVAGQTHSAILKLAFGKGIVLLFGKNILFNTCYNRIYVFN